MIWAAIFYIAALVCFVLGFLFMRLGDGDRATQHLHVALLLLILARQEQINDL